MVKYLGQNPHGRPRIRWDYKAKLNFYTVGHLDGKEMGLNFENGKQM